MIILIILALLSPAFGSIEKRGMYAISAPPPRRSMHVSPHAQSINRMRSISRANRADRVFRLRQGILEKVGMISKVAKAFSKFKINKVLKRVRNWPAYVPMEDPESLSDHELDLLEHSLNRNLNDQTPLISGPRSDQNIEPFSAESDYDEFDQKKDSVWRKQSSVSDYDGHMYLKHEPEVEIPDDYVDYIDMDPEIDHPSADMRDDDSSWTSDDYFNDFNPLEDAYLSDDDSFRGDSKYDFSPLEGVDLKYLDDDAHDFTPFEAVGGIRNDFKTDYSSNDGLDVKDRETYQTSNKEDEFLLSQSVAGDSYHDNSSNRETENDEEGFPLRIDGESAVSSDLTSKDSDSYSLFESGDDFSESNDDFSNYDSSSMYEGHDGDSTLYGSESSHMDERNIDIEGFKDLQTQKQSRMSSISPYSSSSNDDEQFDLWQSIGRNLGATDLKLKRPLHSLSGSLRHITGMLRIIYIVDSNDHFPVLPRRKSGSISSSSESFVYPDSDIHMVQSGESSSDVEEWSFDEPHIDDKESRKKSLIIEEWPFDEPRVLLELNDRNAIDTEETYFDEREKISQKEDILSDFNPSGSKSKTLWGSKNKQSFDSEDVTQATSIADIRVNSVASDSAMPYHAVNSENSNHGSNRLGAYLDVNNKRYRINKLSSRSKVGPSGHNSLNTEISATPSGFSGSTSLSSNSNINTGDIFAATSFIAGTKIGDSGETGDFDVGSSTSDNFRNNDVFRPVRTNGNLGSNLGSNSNNEGSLNSNNNGLNNYRGSVRNSDSNMFSWNHNQRNTVSGGDGDDSIIDETIASRNPIDGFSDKDSTQKNQLPDANQVQINGSPLDDNDDFESENSDTSSRSSDMDDNYFGKRKKVDTNAYEASPNYLGNRSGDSGEDDKSETSGLGSAVSVMLVAGAIVGAILIAQLRHAFSRAPMKSTLNHQDSEEFQIVIDQDKMDEITSNFYSHKIQVASKCRFDCSDVVIDQSRMDDITAEFYSNNDRVLDN